MLNFLLGGRINIASCSLGAANASFNSAIDYMLTRKQVNNKKYSLYIF